MRRSLLNLGVRRSTWDRTSIVDLDSSKWIALLQQPKHLSIMSSFDFTPFISCLVEACGSVYEQLKVILHFFKEIDIIVAALQSHYSTLTALSPDIVDFHILDCHIWLSFPWRLSSLSSREKISVIPLNVVDRRERKSSDLFSFLLLQGHTSCLDSDTEEDYDDIREDLGEAWKLSIGVNDFG